MKTLKRIKLSDLGDEKKMEMDKLLELKGGIDISLFAGCTSKVCTKLYNDQKDDACSGTDVCRSNAEGEDSDSGKSCVFWA